MSSNCSRSCAWCHSPGLTQIGFFCHADRAVKPEHPARLALPVLEAARAGPCWRRAGVGRDERRPFRGPRRRLRPAASPGAADPALSGRAAATRPAAGPGLGLRDLRPRDEGLRALTGRARRGPGGLAAPGRIPGPSTP